MCNLLQQLNSVTVEKVEQNTFLKRQNKRIQLENEILNPFQTTSAKVDPGQGFASFLSYGYG